MRQRTLGCCVLLALAGCADDGRETVSIDSIRPSDASLSNSQPGSGFGRAPRPGRDRDLDAAAMDATLDADDPTDSQDAAVDAAPFGPQSPLDVPGIDGSLDIPGPMFQTRVPAPD